MLKKEFLAKLDYRLKRLDSEDLKEILSYYNQHIDEAVAEGRDESEVISSLGSIDDIASKTYEEFGVIQTRIEKIDRSEKVKRRSAGNQLFVVILLVFFNLIFALGVILGFYGAFIGIFIGGVTSLFAGVFALVTLNFFEGILAIGTGLLLGNIGGAGLYFFTLLMKKYVTWMMSLVRGT
jgi:uncharacterized membrane protein